MLSVNINCAEASVYRAICKAMCAWNIGFKVERRFLITEFNRFIQVCDSCLALNSVSCFETILHARTRNPHAYALTIATRVKFYSGFYFRYLCQRFIKEIFKFLVRRRPRHDKSLRYSVLCTTYTFLDKYRDNVMRRAVVSACIFPRRKNICDKLNIHSICRRRAAKREISDRLEKYLLQPLNT